MALGKLHNCEICGKVFMRVTRPICPQCQSQEEDVLTRIQHYIRDNPKLSLGEVAEACEVTEKVLLKFVRDGRIKVSLESPSALKCSSCGAPILSGVFCSSCQRNLATLNPHEPAEDTSKADLPGADAKTYSSYIKKFRR